MLISLAGPESSHDDAVQRTCTLQIVLETIAFILNECFEEYTIVRAQSKMARSVLPSTWENGYWQEGRGTPWVSQPDDTLPEEEQAHYVTPPSSELLTSPVHNSLGLNTLRTWPTIYDGTNSPHGVPSWWKPATNVDVLISGAGPSGLQVALSLARQGVSFRIVGELTHAAASLRTLNIGR